MEVFALDRTSAHVLMDLVDPCVETGLARFIARTEEFARCPGTSASVRTDFMAPAVIKSKSCTSLVFQGQIVTLYCTTRKEKHFKAQKKKKTQKDFFPYKVCEHCIHHFPHITDDRLYSSAVS